MDRLTGVDVRTREDYHREVRIHFSLLVRTRTDGVMMPATIGNLTREDVTDRVRAEQEGEPDPDDKKKWLRRKADPKSIRNRHGLLYCIIEASMESTPQLRTTNCCKKTSLPRLGTTASSAAST
ncbi:hypothetical protein OG292_27120 [Streptomyces sp. NBC_01511]|uniref:hypothetical protein n=1 Tax=Streptomyces sp. NBC_01511 TaxID=2903889 RepID=UPI003863DACF